MTDLVPLIIAILTGVAVIYLVDDGRVRVGALALLAAFAAWRNRQGILDSSNPVQNGNSSEPIPPDTEALDAEIATTDSRLDSINDTRPGGNVGAALDLLDIEDAK